MTKTTWPARAVIYLATLALLSGLASACGKRTGKAKFNKVKKATPAEQQEKAQESVSEVFDAAREVTNEQNPIDVMNRLEGIMRDKLGDLLSESETQAKQVGKWTVATTEDSLALTLNQADGQWQEIRVDRSNQTKWTSSCEKQKGQQTDTRKGNNKQQTNTPRIKCDRFNVTAGCLDGDRCENRLILAFNLDKNYILPIFHRKIAGKVSQETVVQVPRSVQTSVGTNRIEADEYRFEYTAMVFNENSQTSKVEIAGKSGSNGSTLSYKRDEPAQITVLSK